MSSIRQIIPYLNKNNNIDMCKKHTLSKIVLRFIEKKDYFIVFTLWFNTFVSQITYLSQKNCETYLFIYKLKNYSNHNIIIHKFQ